jgi:hypothetical protein
MPAHAYHLRCEELVSDEAPMTNETSAVAANYGLRWREAKGGDAATGRLVAANHSLRWHEANGGEERSMRFSENRILLLSLCFFESGFDKFLVTCLQGAQVVAFALQNFGTEQNASAGLAVNIDRLVFGK